MNNFKFIFIFALLLLGAIGCATHTSPFASKHENAWFIMHDQSSNNSFPVYCMANKEEKSASPKCYKSKNEGFDH